MHDDAAACILRACAKIMPSTMRGNIDYFMIDDTARRVRLCATPLSACHAAEVQPDILRVRGAISRARGLHESIRCQQRFTPIRDEACRVMCRADDACAAC